MINELLMLLISIMGIVFGYILTFVAFEELKDSKKYFLLMKIVLGICFLSVISYGFIVNQSYYLLTIFLSLGIILLLLNLLVFKKLYFELINYLYFMVAYFLISELIIQAILAVMIFLYGLPTGSLLKKVAYEL
jgi:hypothetical protein